MSGFQGKTVWIIGASSGIGRALAEELGSRGADLILSSRDAGALVETGKKIPSVVKIAPLDVCDAEAVSDCFERIISARDIDSVIYMAGLYQPMEISALDMEQAKTIVATNFMGAVYVVRQVLPYFLKREKGQIALCASVAGYCGLPNAQPYGATKAALINFAESLRCETMYDGIDVKLINPGFVHTRLTDKNNFRMPMMIEPEEAARYIADGLLTKSFEIHFPKKFTRLVKLLRLLPYKLYFALVKK